VRIDLLTLFPEMFYGVLSSSILRRAIENRIIEINLINIRDHSTDKHKRVDDYPYGGGAGMVMMAQPLYDAIQSVKKGSCGAQVVLTSPRGNTFNQRMARQLAGLQHMIIVCGHYEGIDQRIIDTMVDLEVSIGDYVLTGGEIPAMVIIDAVVRLLPGVLGSPASLEEESFMWGLLEYPHYTRPAEFLGIRVPEVLLSGNHGEIRKWRRKKAIEATARLRPELLEQAKLTDEERKGLAGRSGQ
jgi:tRNA (guanine37-N1)-methyltransferase